MRQSRFQLKTILSWIAAGVLLLPLIVPLSAEAVSQLTTRSVVVGSSAASASTSYSITFTPSAAAETIGSFLIQICDSPLSTVGCAAVVATHSSDGASLGSAVLGTITGSGLTSNTGWSILSQTGGSTSGTQLIIHRTSATTTAAGPASITIPFTVVTNPNTTNASYYLRVTSDSDLSGTVPVDFGAVALSTATQIQVTATVQEQLAFSTGTSGSCGSLSGTTVALGILTSASYGSGTSLMCASTNAQSGYAITYNGATLTSGSNTIPVIGGTATALNTVGTVASQFGINAVANTTPSVGAAVSGGGSGTASTNYSTANNYSFVASTPTQIASSSVATANSLFTVSYVTNIVPTQQAGQYATTLTYICTGTF